MDFFQSQETLTTIQWILRAVIGFLFLLIVAKFMGQRAISQLRLIDFVMALVLGNIIAHPLSDEHLAMKGSMITTIVLVILYTGGLWLTLKFTFIEKLLDPPPFPLIKDGEIIYKGLKKAKISVHHLLAELRAEKIEDISKVALALWESNGNISIFLDPKYEPITPELYNIKTVPFDLPRTIVKEGKIETRELKQLNKEEDWVVNTIEKLYQTDLKNVLLATIDNKENLKVFLYK
ncbi:uncharacterized membrane protein YcaP (DUF421 family) [Neobacillus niacini]|uniref:DUF421 domain-containing protein n=1 Tax=Neobacillus niacini TaxID=86668 RepID=UPI0028653DF7|nr:YetF domain-containing protein [Neobacillus niacini]MDR7079154.1 uncharacterized membrane protein YcaP (DUF421 family) [Neobacillus niacini]